VPRECRRRASPTGTGNTGGVRTVPLVGDKAWFGPRRFGWGLSPMSPEGWVLTAASLVATFVLARRAPERPMVRRIPAIVLVIVAVGKGTAPGGPRARSALRAAEQTGGP